MRTLLRRTHDLLRSTVAYPLMLTSAAAVLLIALRSLVTQTPGYRFLIWNLALAWVPYLCGVALFAIAGAPRMRRWIALLAAIWLLFLPNAPYLVTDVVHLRHNTQVGWWYDLVLLVLCAWAGMLLAVVSLRLMQIRVAQAAGRWVGWLFVALMIGLGSVGVAIGRFLRWNSWDLLTQPQTVAADVLASATTAHLDRAMVGLSGGIAMLWLLVYLALATVGRLDAPRAQPG
jgi:uncharacterized membrane protein